MLNGTLSYTITKTLDKPDLRLESETMPVTDSTGGDPPRKISKTVATRDTDLAFGKNPEAEPGRLQSVSLDYK